MGSARVYRALWKACLKMKKVAVCRYTQKVNTPPKLVVLVPQDSVKSDDKESEVCYFIDEHFLRQVCFVGST